MTNIIDSVSTGAIVTIRDKLVKLQSQGHKIFRLESGDPSFSVAPWVAEAMQKAIVDGHTHYTVSAGIQPLREAILEKVRTENKLSIGNVDPIQVTSGGMHGLYLVFCSIFDDSNKNEVIIPDPMWTEIAENVKLGGGVPVRCKLRSDMTYASEDIAALITPRTKALFVNTPHNPTGKIVSPTILNEIVELANKHDLLIISDEAYEHVLFDDKLHTSIGSLPGAANRTISIFSASKSYSMSGLRVGYVVCNLQNTVILDRIKKLLRCSTNGVNSVAQHGLKAALTNPNTINHIKDMSKEYQKRRDILLNAFSGFPNLEAFKPEGGFFLWVKVVHPFSSLDPNCLDTSFTDYLLKAGIGSAPGNSFGPSNTQHVRLSFSCNTEQVEEASYALRKLLVS